MKPVSTPACNFTYRLPGGTEENDLPCRREKGMVTSWWELEGSDKSDLANDTMLLGVHVWGVRNPVGVTLQVGEEGRLLSEASELRLTPSEEGYFYVAELTEEERAELQDDTLVRLAVDLTPIPPVAVMLMGAPPVKGGTP